MRARLFLQRVVAAFATAVLAACGGSRPTTVSVAPQPLPSPPKTVVAAQPRTPPTPEERVQAVLPHWLDLLAHGEDAAFLDEAIVPEQLETILDHDSKATLVKNFAENKHDELVEILRKVRGATPARVVDQDGRTRVTYEVAGEHHITFQVVGNAVHIER